MAFPALGAGARGFPPEVAAEVAVDAVRSVETLVRSIRFVCFDGPTFRAFTAAVEAADDLA